MVGWSDGRMVGWTPSRASLPPFLSLRRVCLEDGRGPRYSHRWPFGIQACPLPRALATTNTLRLALEQQTVRIARLASGSDNPAPPVLGSSRIPGPRPAASGGPPAALAPRRADAPDGPLAPAHHRLSHSARRRQGWHFLYLSAYPAPGGLSPRCYLLELWRVKASTVAVYLPFSFFQLSVT